MYCSSDMSHSECESHVPHLARLVLFSYFDEIWHDDAYWPPTVERPLKFRIIENSGWRQLPSGKSQKSQYLRNGLTDLYEIWYADAKWVS